MARLLVEFDGSKLEVEGSEQFIETLYKRFCERIESSSNSPSKGSVSRISDDASQKLAGGGSTKEKREESPSKQRKRGSAESYKVLGDLDLYAKDNAPALKEFFEQKEPASAFEMNAVFIYYLTHLKKLSSIGIDHIYSCYKEVGTPKIPEKLRQSLFDTRSKKGWIDTADVNNLTLTLKGEKFVEHELPAKKSTSKAKPK